MKIDLLDQIDNHFPGGEWISEFEMKSVENLILKWLGVYIKP
jgi:hypothetical protein